MKLLSDIPWFDGLILWFVFHWVHRHCTLSNKKDIKAGIPAHLSAVFSFCPIGLELTYKVLLKTFYQTYSARKPTKLLPAAPEWRYLLLRDVICIERVPFHCCRGWTECTVHFLSLVTTFDLDLQTHLSKGPNMSSLWIWRKTAQQFWIYLIHEQKKTKKIITALKMEPYLRAVK